MKIRIFFPKSNRYRVYEVKLTEGMSIEDIAYQVALQMYYEQVGRGIRIRDKVKWINGQMRWLIPRIMSCLLEVYGELLWRIRSCYYEAYYSPTPWIYIPRCIRVRFEKWLEEKRRKVLR